MWNDAFDVTMIMQNVFINTIVSCVIFSELYKLLADYFAAFFSMQTIQLIPFRPDVVTCGSILNIPNKTIMVKTKFFSP